VAGMASFGSKKIAEDDISKFLLADSEQSVHYNLSESFPITNSIILLVPMFISVSSHLTY
jgi:hypothetical protein